MARIIDFEVLFMRINEKGSIESECFTMTFEDIPRQVEFDCYYYGEDYKNIDSCMLFEKKCFKKCGNYIPYVDTGLQLSFASLKEYIESDIYQELWQKIRILGGSVKDHNKSWADYLNRRILKEKTSIPKFKPLF